MSNLSEYNSDTAADRYIQSQITAGIIRTSPLIDDLSRKMVRELDYIIYIIHLRHNPLRADA